jgi:hypothetical protein
MEVVYGTSQILGRGMFSLVDVHRCSKSIEWDQRSVGVENGRLPRLSVADGGVDPTAVSVIQKH